MKRVMLPLSPRELFIPSKRGCDNPPVPSVLMSAVGAAAPALRPVAPNHLTWHQVDVCGRRAVYGVGGVDGPPIVFLHGWALGSRAYKRAVNRLVARGCQVYAPALPSFGGTADLPAEEMNLDGYAAWVTSFMDAVGISEPALVIGHSFGGGVAIKLAYRYPNRVSYLVLLNAVGAVPPRRPWDWAAGFGRDMWPPGVAFDLAQAVRSDLMPNLLRNPCALLRAAWLAQRADLRREAAELRDRGSPVLVITSDGDGIIPRTAFEALCGAIGSDSQIVSGGHSWLLADPDSFGEALAPVVDLCVDEHRSSRASSRATEVAALLEASHLPPQTVQRLLAAAPPLWLISEAAPVLAGDLLLAHPPLHRHEVRAIARPVEDSTLVRVTIVAADRRGLLADSAAVLTASGLSISRACAATWPTCRLAMHSFVVEGAEASEASWADLGQRLQVMAATSSLPPLEPIRPHRVTIHGGDGDRIMVTITAPDEPGVLSTLCRTFAAGGMNIESLNASTSNAIACDTFLVAAASDAGAVTRLFTEQTAGAPRPGSGPRRSDRRGDSPRGPDRPRPAACLPGP